MRPTIIAIFAVLMGWIVSAQYEQLQAIHRIYQEGKQ